MSFSLDSTRHRANHLDASHRAERRRRARTAVHWPLTILRAGGATAIDTVTHDLSNRGFYCLSPAALVPGEFVICTIALPASARRANKPVRLVCRATVLRSEAAPDGFFGIACRIDDYHLIAPRLDD